VHRKRRAQEGLVLTQHAGVLVAQALQQLGRALDVSEQEGDGAGGE
jgi:hypothetical protein